MRRAIPIACLLACACQADVAPPDPPVVVVETPVVWRASEATLQSDAFTGADTLPEVRLNGLPRPVRFLGGARIAVLMPDSIGTWIVTVAVASGATGAPDTITTGGAFIHRGSARPAQRAMAWPQRYGRQIAANDFAANRVVLIDLANPGVALALPIPDSMADPGCLLLGPGPSVTGGLVLGRRTVANGCWGTQVWSYSANNTFIATDSLGVGPFSAYLGNGNWLAWNSHAYHQIHAGQWTLLQGVEGGRAVISPRHDRVAPMQGLVDPALGAPVFNVATPSVAFHIPAASIAGADFSQFGDTLFTGVAQSGQPYRIVAVDATSGTLLGGSDTLRLGYDVVLLADPARPWLYLMFTDVQSRPQVTVLDRQTMKVVAHLRIPMRHGPRRS